jgi:hypothetical protein
LILRGFKRGHYRWSRNSTVASNRRQTTPLHVPLSVRNLLLECPLIL